MARIHIKNLLDILANYDAIEPEQHRSEEPAQISFHNYEDTNFNVYDLELAHKTLTYESPTVTVVLDFDDKGLLYNIMFI